jgi:CubicO group peptidase (beta-lactamase class C family)
MKILHTQPRLLALLVLVSVVAAATAPRAQAPAPVKPESVGLSSARLQRLARAIRDEMSAGRTPGAVVAIARKGKLAYYESFGYVDPVAKTPMPKDAIFALASMTKPMATVATLMLVEEGRLLLNEPVGKYLPALKDMKVATPRGLEPPRRAPTLQDMLRHTAGVSYGNRGDTPLHRLYEQRVKNAANQSAPQFLEELGKLPLHYQPGTQWEYSYGIDVAALAVEAVSGKSLGQFLQERLFTPLGMVDTGFIVPAAKAARIAKPLPTDPLTGAPSNFRNPVTPWQYECGGGCAQGTALDYMRFAQMLLNNGELDGTRILGRKFVEFMTADQLGPDVDASRLDEFAVDHLDGYGFGLGVAVRRQTGRSGVPGTPGEFHWTGAQGTMFWVDPKEELVVVYLGNTPGLIRRYYRQLVKSLVLQTIVD